MIQDPNVSFLHRARLLLVIISIILPILFLIYKFTHPTLSPYQEVSTAVTTQNPSLGLETIEINKMLPLRGTTKEIIINTQGNLAYVAAYGQGVHTLSLEKPLAPVVLSSFKYNDRYDGVIKLKLSKDEKSLYVLDEKKGVYSLDVRDPSTSKLIDFIAIPNGQSMTLSSSGHKIYISGKFGLGIININQDGMFALLGRLHYLSGKKTYTMEKFLPHQQYNMLKEIADVVEVDANTLYLMSRHPDVVDVSDLSNIKVITHFSTLGFGRQATISGNRQRMYLSSGDSGIEIFDISDYKSPRPLGGHNTESSAGHTSISKDKNILYVSTCKGGLQVFDITYPYDPKLIKRVDIKKDVKKGHAITSALSRDEKVLYIAYGVSGLGIVSFEQTK